MRLAFIIENLMPHESGGGYYAIFRFAEYLAKRGHDVLVYAIHDLGWVSPTENMKIIYRPSIPRQNRIYRKLDKFIERVTDQTHLKIILQKFRPDWILGVLRESAIKACKMGKIINVPVAQFVYECPLWLEEVGGDRFRSKYHGYFKSSWENTRKAYLESQVLFPNSELAGDYMSKWLAGKEIAEPIFPGIDLDDHDHVRNSPAVTVPIFLYVGRLAPLKNVDLLIRATKKIKQNIECHICGTGPEEQSLKELAGGSKNIVFHGFVSDEKLWELMNSCRALVYPTSFEGFGMPPMQAFFFGKPCIASDIPILRSIYGNHIDYFPHLDESKLIELIEKMIADPAYCEKRGSAGRKYIEDKFTWQKAAERIEANLLSFSSINTCEAID